MSSLRKVFISYYHDDDQFYKETICDLNEQLRLFDDYSVALGDIDDEHMSDEQIRVKIRDDYIRDSDVLIVLCGKNTKSRKFIDWEIHASMYNTEKNPKMGIIVVNLPLSDNGVCATTDREKEIVAPSSSWRSITDRTELERMYPDCPSRIIDSLYTKHSSITFVNWSTIRNNFYLLQELIEIAYQRRKTVEYDLSAPLRRRNS